MEKRESRLIELRDTVDNLCHQLACDVGGLDDIPWDMEFIGEIRDAAIAYIVKYTGQDELEIYP